MNLRLKIPWTAQGRQNRKSKIQNPKSIAGISLFVLWIFFVLGSFFAVQKPFLANNALAFGNVLLDLLTAGWITLVSLGIGVWLWQRFWPGELSLLEQTILGTGAGLGLLGLLGLGLGAVGLFEPVVAYGLMLGLSLVAGPVLWRLVRQQPWGLTDRPHPLAAGYLVVIGLLTLSVALLPPTDWDGLFYHLTGPKLYLQVGGIIGGIDVPHFNFPSLMEMLFTWAMLLRGDVAAKLIHAVFGLLLAGLVYLTAQHFFGQRAAWPSVLILTSMPMVATLAGWAYNDLGLAFYQLASLYAIGKWKVGRLEGWKVAPVPGTGGKLESWRIKDGGLEDGSRPGEVGELAAENPKSKIPWTDRQDRQNPKSKIPWAAQSRQNRGWLILSGIFAGLAMGMKYTSFVTPLTIGGIILYQLTRLDDHSTKAKPRTTHYALRIMHYVSRFTDFALFSLTALLIACPWYIKNWLLTGNPVYPFLYNIFGGIYWDSFRAAWYAAGETGIGWRPDTLLALPWLLTLGVRDVNYWDGRTGPLLLLFLPVVIWFSLSLRSADRPRVLNAFLVYVLAHFCFWTLGVIWSQSLFQARLLLPGLVGLTPLAGWAWANLTRLDLPQFSISRFAVIAIGLALALTVIDVGLLTLKINPMFYLAGLESRDQYLTRRLGAHYEAMQQINERLPAGAKVLFLWEPRSYYCRRNCLPDSILERFPHVTHRYGSAKAIAEAWQEMGVTHVLIHRAGLNFVLSESPEVVDVAILAQLETDFLDLAGDVGEAYQLYTLDIKTYQP